MAANRANYADMTREEEDQAICNINPNNDQLIENNNNNNTKKQTSSLCNTNLTTNLLINLTIIISSIIIITNIELVQTISIKPADFDRYIMPCYLGGSSSYNSLSQQQQPISQLPLSRASPGVQIPGAVSISNPNANYDPQASVLGRTTNQAPRYPSGDQNGNGYSQQPAYFGGGGGANGLSSQQTSDLSQINRGIGASYAGASARDGFNSLGQQVPRANTMDNFIALLSKIESANPRLANNPDQLIRMLLNRFRMDNYYYDVRNRVPISDQDPRTRDIIPALLSGPSQVLPGGQQFAQSQQPQYSVLGSDLFPEQLLDHDEKCSMYFMLSHFIDKTMPMNPALASMQPSQLSGPPDRNLRPPSLQAAGSGYPAQSAANAFGGSSSQAGGASRYQGPSPSFGSPATNGMYSFGAGINNQPEYTGNNPMGQNVLRENSVYQQNYNQMRTSGQYSGMQSAGQSRYSTPYLDGLGRSRDERQATEFGVVSVGNQENAALVLNRVLMGILAAATPPQSIRQLAAIMYPTQSLSSTPKIDDEIDPLYAVTLADLWAISSIPKSGKVNDFRLGDNGHWNDTMCPTSFILDRSSSIRFTTAELIGGLDGFALGMFRRRMMSMRKNIRLSDLLRMYYSKAGFRPQYAEVSVCNRASALSSQMDDLRRQAENYLRLYQLNLPISDDQISSSISRLDSFREVVRQISNQYAPQDICLDSSVSDGGYPTMNSQDQQCEIAKADLVTVLDTSMQSNDLFMNLVVNKLAQKIGLSRQGNTLSVLTNQQDTTGYAGAYSFNAVVKNSSNTGEIGCALMYDTSRSYQGGQITDPTRLMEMFERALINLDSEYLVRQVMGPISSSSSSIRQSSYVSSLFGAGGNMMDANYLLGGSGPKNTGGSKVLIWFNYGSQPRTQSISSVATNWNNPSYSDQNQYKLHEAKKFLRENFRGAAILAVANNKEDVKAFVFDEERDIFTDIPQGNNGLGGSSADYYPSQGNMMDAAAVSSMNGPADQLVTKLLQRMCDIPSLFQYPMCFRIPSENVAAVGFITPGKKQYWMMSPKTFFASRSVRMVFKVEGGRLRVCFGRMTRPDESAARNQDQYQSGTISFGNPAGGSNPNQIQQSSSSSSNNYYTGLNNGICKDISPGQEIDFIVDDPCYKKSIAECEPFYFVIREISNPGEGDPNYMCKDEGCKRFDQVRFIMTHTGVTCSSAFKNLNVNWFLIIMSITTVLCMSPSEIRGAIRATPAKLIVVIGFLYVTLQQVQAQQAGVYDFGQGRYGEKRGTFTPSEVLAIILLIMTILAGLALTIGLCYYVTKKNSRGMTRVEQNDY